MGGVSPVLYQPVVPERLVKISADARFSAPRGNFHLFLWKVKNSISASKCPITAPKICTWSLLLSKFSYHTHRLLNGGRPQLWARLPGSGHNPHGGVGRGVRNGTQASSPVFAFIGGSERRGRGGVRRGEGEQICPCTKCCHVHIASTLSLFLISPFCCCSLSRYKKVPQERYKYIIPFSSITLAEQVN